MSDGICEKRIGFGVLFVGGFGVQGSGTAIASLGGALYRWLFHWSCQADLWDESSPKLEDTVLTASGGADNEPAHLILDLPLRLGPDEPSEQSRGRWLLAESSWADLFAPPRFLGMARWIWKVSTCLLVLQFVIPMRRHWRQARMAQGPWRLADCAMAACYLVLMGVAAMMSVLLSGVLLALAVAAHLPIPRIEQAVHWVVVRVSAVLGDSYMLAHCPVQLAAMRTQVAGDLRWLQERCEKVAIVAHSQGAAIAHRVLKDGSSYRVEDLRAFITLGQGISKLHMLQHLDWDPRVRPAARRSRLLVSIGMACAGLPALGLIVSRWANPGVVTFLINVRHSIPLILAGFAVIWLGVSQAMRAMQVIEGDLKRELGFRRESDSDTGDFSWSDYYASADPVSNGPLDPGSGSPQSRQHPADGNGEALLLPSPCNQVSNSGSVLFDHNGYLRNQNQLVSMLLNDLVAAAHKEDGDSQAPPPLVSAAAVETASQRRRWLVAWLLGWRFLAVGIGVTLWQVNPGPLFKHPMNWLVHLFAPHAGMSDGVARLAAVVVITAAMYILVAVIPWRIMEEHEVHRFFDAAQRRADIPRPGSPTPRSRPDWRILVRWPRTSANHRA